MLARQIPPTREESSCDFSREILQRTTERDAVIPMKDVLWCDWGRPERIQATLTQLKMTPLFPVRLINEDKLNSLSQALETATV
jgi:hypothetical protein